MPTIKYSNNPNSDTAFVVQDGGQKNRAVLTAEPAGTLQLSDSANVSTGYVTDEDGKKHKVNLVAQLEGDIEFSENPNSTKGYATVDGKKHRVVLTASLAGGGSAPVIDELNVTPSTSAQEIIAPEGTDGYSPVNVSAVTSAIDANIVAGNIKKDVSILGVTGSYEGVAPSGTKNITSNGTHDVAGYANADVNVPTTAPAHYREYAVDANGKLINSGPLIDLTGITDLGDNVLIFAYRQISGITANLNFSSLTTISGINALQAAFQMNNSVQTVSFPALTTISGNSSLQYCFQLCSNLTTFSAPSLTTISGANCFANCFSNCSALTNVDLSALTTISGNSAMNNTFTNCSALTSLSFAALTAITGMQAMYYCFQNCKNLTSLSFPALTSASFGSYANQFNSMLSGVTGCTVHFPTNLQSVIGSWTSVTNGFGGTNTTVLFDLPATE